MSEVKKHLQLLGKEVKDKVTGATGIVTSISFDLYGCVQAIVNPGLDKNKKAQESGWYDVGRLKVTNKKPVMTVPNFKSGVIAKGKKGPANKPLIQKP